MEKAEKFTRNKLKRLLSSRVRRCNLKKEELQYITLIDDLLDRLYDSGNETHQISHFLIANNFIEDWKSSSNIPKLLLSDSKYFSK